MAFPPHCLIAFQGGWNEPELTEEVWQFGIRLSTHDPSGGYLANPQTYLDSITTALTSWFTGPGNMLSNKATCHLVKCNNITPAGHYKDPVTHQAVMAATGGYNGSAPIFNTIATTLETGHTTGKARRGRVYPPFGVVLDPLSGVKVTATNRDAYRASIKALLTILLKNEPTGGLLVNPIVASRIDGNYNDINGVSVDDVIDVQRRRKNRAAGIRSSVLAFP